MRKYISAIIIMATVLLSAQEAKDENVNWTAARPDGHAPISVMGDHMHHKGEWMFSYRYRSMDMKDLKQGSKAASTEEALDNYMATPIKMPLNMQMVGVMYAPSNTITLMGMINYLSMKMDHVTRMGEAFTTESSGVGDLQLSALYKLWNGNRQTLHGQLGVSIPTGSITKSDVTPASAPNETVLPYSMQPGSGTLSTNLALTYLGQCHSVSWGSQLKGVFRLGHNDRDYRLGNQYGINNWLAYKVMAWFSVSASLEGLIVENIHGADPNLNPMMVITADTDNSGGTYLNSGIGLNTYIPQGVLKNLRLGLEYGFPLYQDVNGIQLKRKETLTLGLQYSL